MMDYRWGCQDLKPQWRATLTEIVTTFKTGGEARCEQFNLRVLVALQRRHYIEEYSELRRSPLHNGEYVQFLYRPTAKALALWQDEKVKP